MAQPARAQARVSPAGRSGAETAAAQWNADLVQVNLRFRAVGQCPARLQRGPAALAGKGIQHLDAAAVGGQ